MVCYSTQYLPPHNILNCRYFQQEKSQYCVFDRFPADTIYGQARKQRGAKRGRRGAGEGPYREGQATVAFSGKFSEAATPSLVDSSTHKSDRLAAAHESSELLQPAAQISDFSAAVESWISLAQNNHISWWLVQGEWWRKSVGAIFRGSSGLPQVSSDQLIPPPSIDKPATRTYWSNTSAPTSLPSTTGFLWQTNRISSEAERDFPRRRGSAVFVRDYWQTRQDIDLIPTSTADSVTWFKDPNTSGDGSMGGEREWEQRLKWERCETSVMEKPSDRLAVKYLSRGNGKFSGSVGNQWIVGFTVIKDPFLLCQSNT